MFSSATVRLAYLLICQPPDRERVHRVPVLVRPVAEGGVVQTDPVNQHQRPKPREPPDVRRPLAVRRLLDHHARYLPQRLRHRPRHSFVLHRLPRQRLRHIRHSNVAASLRVAVTTTSGNRAGELVCAPAISAAVITNTVRSKLLLTMQRRDNLNFLSHANANRVFRAVPPVTGFQPMNRATPLKKCKVTGIASASSWSLRRLRLSHKAAGTRHTTTAPNR